MQSVTGNIDTVHFIIDTDINIADTSSVKLTPEQLAALRKESGSNRLAAAIRIAGTTQERVASALHLSQPRVSDLTGADDVRLGLARRIAALFGCTVDDIFPVKAKRKARDFAQQEVA